MKTFRVGSRPLKWWKYLECEVLIYGLRGSTCGQKGSPIYSNDIMGGKRLIVIGLTYLCLLVLHCRDLTSLWAQKISLNKERAL